MSARTDRAIRAALTALALATTALAVNACGDDGEETLDSAPTNTAAPAPAPAPAPKPATASRADAGVAPPADLPPLPERAFQERDFSETAESRDPFRSFASMFAAQAQTRTNLQRKVVVDRYALDELKLVGVVTRTAARALFVDPSGYGWVAKVGDFVGKAEIVHTGGPSGTDVAINWRVDRIRDADVVFVREDPSHPEIPPTTRVVALRTPEEEAAMKQDGMGPR